MLYAIRFHILINCKHIIWVFSNGFILGLAHVNSTFELGLKLGNQLYFSWPIYFQRSATLSPLDNEDWVAVQAMILQQEENQTLDRLQG